VLFRNLLLMNFDGSDRQFVIALDKRNREDGLGDQAFHRFPGPRSERKAKG
jgi:hypothetical protein